MKGMDLLRRPLPSGREAFLGALVLAVGMSIAWLPLPWAAAGVLGTAVVLLVLARPIYGLYLLVFSVPFEGLAQRQVAGFTVSSTELLAFLVLLSWLISLALPQAFRSLRPLPLLWPVLGLLAMMALSASLARAWQPSVKEMLKWAELLAVYTVAAHIVRRREGEALIACLLAAGSLQALLGFYQFFERVGPPSFAIGPFLRAYGSFEQPNPYGGYLNMVLPLALGLCLAGRRRGAVGGGIRQLPLPFAPGWLYLAGGAGALMLVALGMTFSRGAWLGLGAAVAVMVYVLHPRRAFLVLLGLLLVAALAADLGRTLPPALAGRWESVVSYFGVFDVRTVAVTPQNWALVDRMAQWQAAWEMFSDHPWAGVGPGNYPVAYKDYALPGWPEARGHAHNIYLNFLAEMGILGLAAYLIFWAAALWQVGARATNSLGWEGGLALGILGVLAAATAHNFFDSLFVHGMNAQLGLLLGVAAAIGGKEHAHRY